MILKPQNVRRIGECLSWRDVDCADGYKIYLDGELVTETRNNKYTVTTAGKYTVSAFCRNDTEEVNTAQSECVSVDLKPTVSNNDYLPSLVRETFVPVFEDNFSSGEINSTNWATAQPWGPDTSTNGELQYYVDTQKNESNNRVNPFSFSNDNLIITADNAAPDPSYNLKPFTSGVLTTFDKFTFKYGYIEWRFLASEFIQAYWAAFWLYATSFNRAEIDISEIVGNENYGSMVANWQAYHTGNPLMSLDANRYSSGSTWSCDGDLYDQDNGWNLPDLISGEFNTAGCLWQENCLTMFLNGKPVNSICDREIITDEEMYLALNLAVGGTLGGEPNTTFYPASLVVDYVRVLQSLD